VTCSFIPATLTFQPSSDGRQLKHSTKTTDRNQVQEIAIVEIAIELERVERRAMQGTLTTTQLRRC
jgi:hypothetical protein